MFLTFELLEVALNLIEASDLETTSIKSFGYVLIYHGKTAELMAVESPDEIGRRVFAAIAKEYQCLACYLATRKLANSPDVMKGHYSSKCDLIDEIKKDAKSTGKTNGTVFSVDSEGNFRKLVGDVRYFLNYHSGYVSTESIRVSHIQTRRILVEAANFINEVENAFRRWDLGELDWFSDTIKKWCVQCIEECQSNKFSFVETESNYPAYFGRSYGSLGLTK